MTEKEFHNERIPFYFEQGFDHEIKILQTGKSHKECLGWRYDYVENNCVRGYLKDRVLMLYQGKNFEEPTEYYDIERLLRALNITKSSLDYIGLGCKVGEVGEQWEPLKKIELGPKFKYISYMITLGGDAGWRFSNREEWCSSSYYLLFDSEKWTMESIANEMKEIYRKYRSTHGFTLAEEYDNGIGFVKELISRDGVYVMGEYLGASKEKQLYPSPDEIEVWNMNGKTSNYDYYQN